MPEITIILPVYNGQSTIQQTVSSLLNQSFSDFELLACIDGTSDQSEEIIHAFKDPRIRVIRNETNLGLGRTLNRLVSNSHPSVKYIAMAEQDDYYYPERLKLQMDFLNSNPDYGMVSGIAEHFDGKKSTSSFPGLLVKGLNYPVNPREMFLLNYCYQVKVTNSCMMFRKSTHVDNGLYFSMHFPSISVDWAYILRFSLISKIKGLHVPLVKLDRTKNRKSLTNQNILRFKTSREIIKAFYFENKNLISISDYKCAWTSEHLIELASMPYLRRLLMFPIWFCKNPGDSRWTKFIQKHLFRMKV